MALVRCRFSRNRYACNVVSNDDVSLANQLYDYERLEERIIRTYATYSKQARIQLHEMNAKVKNGNDRKTNKSNGLHLTPRRKLD